MFFVATAVSSTKLPWHFSKMLGRKSRQCLIIIILISCRQCLIIFCFDFLVSTDDFTYFGNETLASKQPSWETPRTPQFNPVLQILSLSMTKNLLSSTKLSLGSQDFKHNRLCFIFKVYHLLYNNIQSNYYSYIMKLIFNLKTRGLKKS